MPRSAKPDYNAKRDFRRTPEPPLEPAAGAVDEQSFVIHRHEARRLHYDLRLATAGVLASWAVPRGFSYDPQVKHLAVHTEDHPMLYRTFEGVIPKGEYGAGTMLIWDAGTYEVVKADDLQQAIAGGEVKVILRGHRLRGEWHLVRTDDDQDEWLLFKARDRYAREADELVPPIDLTHAKPAALPARPKAMLPAAGEPRAAFSDPSWVFELELDGMRALAVRTDDKLRFVRRTGTAAKLHPQVVAAMAGDFDRVRAENVVLDGVFVALDERNRPSRAAMQTWADGGAEPQTVSFYAFDLLYFDEFDLRAMPLLERKHLLRSLLPPLRKLLYVDHVAGGGESLAAAAEAAGFTSLLAKRADSSYRAGPQDHWLRVSLSAAAGAADLEVNEALARTKANNQRNTRFKLSNLGKVFWPREGYTKGDLIEFYEQVAETLLPYLHERPVHMKRYPDGIEGKSFYQRQAPAGMPDWVELIEVDDEHDKQFICNDRQTLLYLVNLGSIELHPWLSRRGSLDSPDFAVLDLDAKESGFAEAVRVARTAGKVLRGIGMRPSIKTSGASGIHIYMPLVPGYSYDQARMFIEGIARIVAREHPDIASVERRPGGRGGRIYVDFLQNRKSATVVPPYVARPVPGASVSMPLDWDELDSELHPSMFTIKNVPALLAKRGDLFRGTLSDAQDFAPAIAKLEEYLHSA